MTNPWYLMDAPALARKANDVSDAAEADGPGSDQWKLFDEIMKTGIDRIGRREFWEIVDDDLVTRNEVKS
jgi:hypothetical protein